jgi:predicted dehydrogenase
VSVGPLRLAVVGLGYWGPNLVRVLHELEGVELTAVCDRDDSRLARVARRYPSLRLVTSFDELVDDEELDAVAIATPVSTHHELAAKALDAGKHVFVEKPLAASSEEAADLVARAAAQELVVMPGHTFLYSPPVNAIKRLIQSGELGEIYFISTSRVNLGLHQSDVSVVWDLAPHDLSILRYWLDELPATVSAISRSCVIPDVPDVAFVNLRFPSGLVAHVELAWLAPSKLRRTAVVGSRKMAVYDDTSNEPVRIFDSGAELPDPNDFGEYRLSYRTGDIVSPRLDAVEPLASELLDFCEAIRTGAIPRSSAGLGSDVVAVMEAIDRSLETGGDTVPVGSLAGV